jgi:HNH endonuclease
MLTKVEFLDKETMTAELAAATCKSCGSIGGKMEVVLGIQGPHFARVNCQACGAWIDWVGYPVAAPKSDRRKSRKKLRDLGDRCEICLRHLDELPRPVKLEVHHVLEVVADDGPDDRENLRVYCSACHAMVNWVRTYFGHYHLPVAPSGLDADTDL